MWRWEKSERSEISRIESTGMTFWEAIKDKWLTWRTGRSKNERDYLDWRVRNIVSHASDVTNYFQGFKYIIAVDHNKVCTQFDPMHGLMESDEFLSYMHPHRPLGENCYYGWFRGVWDHWDHRFHINDFGGIEQIFIATNSEEDAIMISLKWS